MAAMRKEVVEEVENRVFTVIVISLLKDGHGVGSMDIIMSRGLRSLEKMRRIFIMVGRRRR